VIHRAESRHWVVRMSPSSACSGCGARSSCTLSSASDRFVDIPRDGRSFGIGEEVQLSVTPRQGFRAVFWAYVLPLIVFLSVLFGSYALWVSQGLSALLGLVALAVYYAGLYRFSEALSASVSCSMDKLSQ